MSPACLDYCRLLVELTLAEVYDDRDLASEALDQMDQPWYGMNNVERRWALVLSAQLDQLVLRSEAEQS